jgi:hypothetical protein
LIRHPSRFRSPRLRPWVRCPSLVRRSNWTRCRTA